MTYLCRKESVINSGHLNEAGEQTAMVARCPLPEGHDSQHFHNYRTILLKDLPAWRKERRG